MNQSLHRTASAVDPRPSLRLIPLSLRPACGQLLLPAKAAVFAVCAVSLLMRTVPAASDPGRSGELPSIEDTNPPVKVTTSELCNAPQNADDFPSSPVPIQEGKCEIYQEFKSISPNANYGGSCGGFTVAFGPKGDLKLAMKRYRLRADWGDTGPTPALCAGARVTAAAWGYRCDDTDCTAGAWERIGTAKSRNGSWSRPDKRCVLELTFLASNKTYQTLNVDVIASQKQGGTTERRRAKASIYAERGNGKCVSVTKKIS